MFADLFDEGDDDTQGTGASNAGVAAIKVPKPTAARSSGGFVGLQNQGSTCYMNALLQVMYMTPELRAGLFQVEPNELGFAEVMESEREAAAAEAAAEVAAASTPPPPPPAEVDATLLQSLTDMGFDEHGSRRTLLVTKGVGGLDAALNYYLEHSEDPGFTDAPPGHSTAGAKAAQPAPSSAAKKKRKPRLIPLELQRLFAQLQHLDVYAQSTTDLTSKGFQWQGMDGRVQHDAHELNRLLLDALEKSLKHTSGERLCQSLYRGELANRIKCLRCGTVKDRREEFFDLMTQVLGCPDMASSMRTYLAAELLDGDNAYACEVCGVKSPAHKGTVVLQPLPPILSLSLQRFDIDRRSWERVKVKSSFEFPLMMDMNQFVERERVPNRLNDPLSAEPDAEAALLAGVRGSMLWLGDAVAHAMRVATELVSRAALPAPMPSGDDSGEAPDDSAQSSALAAEVLASLSKEDLSDIQSALLRKFATGDGNASLYELFAVITHCGSAYSGHYFAYIRDCFGSGSWKMPHARSGAKRAPLAMAAADPEQTKSSTVPQDQYRERSRAELAVESASSLARFVVNSDSPLGLLIRIVMEEGTELPKEYYQTNERENDSPTYMPIGRIGAAVKKHIKRTWKDSFSVGMTEFVKRFPSDLISYLNTKESFVVWDVSKIEFLDAATFISSAPKKTADVKEPDVISVSTADAHTDEALALEIARKWAEEDSPATAAAPEGGDAAAGWEVVGDKKQRRSEAENREGQEKASVEAAASRTARQAAQQQQELAAAIADEVGNRLLNSVFGEYWEFNDSSVTPICLSTLAKAFESTNSAYILVYRKKVTLGSADDSRSAVPDAPAAWLEVVQRENTSLAAKRAEYEEYAEAARAGTVDLCVRCPAHVQVDDLGGSLLTLRSAGGTEQSAVQWREGLYVRCANATTLEELRQFVADRIGNGSVENYGVSLQPGGGDIPLAAPPAAWGGDRSSLLKNKMAAIGKNISPPPTGAAALSVLSARGGGAGWYPTDALELIAAKNEKMSVRRGNDPSTSTKLSYENTTVGDLVQALATATAVPLEAPMYPSSTVSENGRLSVLSEEPPAAEQASKIPPARSLSLNLLLWNDNRIGDVLVPNGAAHEPRLFAVRVLVPSTSGEGSRPVSLWETEMWVSSSTPVEALCGRVRQWAEALAAQCPDSLLPHFDKVPSYPLSVYVIETYGTLKTHAKAHAKGIYAKLLFDGETSSVVRAVKKDSVARDLQGSELVVEYVPPLRKKSAAGQSLAEIESSFRNNEIEVSFEFDEKLQRQLRQWPSEDSTGTAVATDTGPLLQPAKSAVDYTQTLGDLKLRMLKFACLKCLSCLSPDGASVDGDMDAMGGSILDLCVLEMTDRVRIRINPDLAGIMSEENVDESKAASTALKSGDVLLLELGEPRAAGSITLQCVPVFGNDVAVKRNPRREGFKASHLKLEQTFNIDKDSTVSIEEVRLSFLAAMNALIEGAPKNEEGVCHLDPTNTRLRTTNWAEEASDMPLGEISSSTRSPLLLSAVAASGLLKSKSLLLLEMGRPPLPGMLELEIFIDTRDMALYTDHSASDEPNQSSGDSAPPPTSRFAAPSWREFVGILSCDLDTPLVSLQEQALKLAQEQLPVVYNSRIRALFGAADGSLASGEGEEVDSSSPAIDFTAYGAVVPENMESFVLREVRDDADSLPGRCLWVRGGALEPMAREAERVAESAEEKTNNVVSTASAKKGAAGKRGGEKKKNGSFASSLVASVAAPSTPTPSVTKSTIRRAKLSSGSRRLVIHLLPSGATHSGSIGGDGAMRLWVARSTLAATSDSYAGWPLEDRVRDRQWCPEGMPVDVQLNAGPIPSLPQLKRAIERDLDVPFHSQRVFKLFHAENCWKDLDAIAEKRRKTAKGSDNLLAVPYLLKDGDFLSVVQLAGQSGASSTAFGAPVVAAKASVEYLVDRPIDEYRRQQAISGAGEKSKKKKRNQQEIGLRLAGDFDFSDDEDES